MMMELDKFIQQTLESIATGVEAARAAVRQQGGFVNPKPQGLLSRKSTSDGGRQITSVDFDVAVTTGEGSESKGGAGIFVFGLGLGAGGRNESATQSVSRIRFAVPIVLPEDQTHR